MEAKNTKVKQGMIIEDLDSKLDLILEGQDALLGRMDRLETKMDDFKKEVDYKFEVVIEELKDKVGRTEFKEFKTALAALAK